jgi:hypothetical protein
LTTPASRSSSTVPSSGMLSIAGERARQTRDQIIDAAESLFLTDGYAVRTSNHHPRPLRKHAKRPILDIERTDLLRTDARA